MPPQQQTYEITDPKTGRTIEMIGSRVPNEMEIRLAFAKLAADTAKPTPAPTQAERVPTLPAPPPARSLLDTVRMPYLGVSMRDASDLAIGGAKELGKLGRLPHMVPGFSEGVDMLMGREGLSRAAFAEDNPDLTPSNPMQRIGQIGTMIASMLAPSGAITNVGARASAKLAPILAPMIGRTAANLLPRAGVEAVANAGMAAVQGGDMRTAAALGGAVPLVAGAARGAVNLARPTVRLNPSEAAAVALAKREGVPLDAATATGADWVRNTQSRVANSWAGHGVAKNLAEQQQGALSRVGNQLTEAANAQGAAHTGVSAAEAVRASLTTLRAKFSAQADTAYDTLRAIEAKAPAETRAIKPGAPFQSMKLAVDVRPVKTALQGEYRKLLREAELVPLQGEKQRALTALDRLMRGPDFAPLSVADGALGDLKALSRIGDGEVRSIGKGLAAAVVKRLDAAVQSAAAKAGPKALKALQEGRAATKAKYQVNEVLEQLADEPRQLFNKLTAKKDGGIALLRSVERHAPKELPNVGRAYLEELLDIAGAEGGFGHADKLFAEWRKLGPETRRLLFPAKLASDLDNFFLLAKMIGKDANPSGTSKVPQLNLPELLALVPSRAFAQLLFTPGGVKVMSEGLKQGDPNKILAAATRIGAVQGSKASSGQ